MKTSIATALLALTLVATAGAKEGVKARLITPVPLGAPAGGVIRLGWTLSYMDAGKAHPFGATGVFVRLRGARGGSTLGFATERGRGRYFAVVRIPRGGIARIEIGLRGMNDYGTADIYFPIVNDPFARRR